MSFFFLRCPTDYSGKLKLQTERSELKTELWGQKSSAAVQKVEAAEQPFLDSTLPRGRNGVLHVAAPHCTQASHLARYLPESFSAFPLHRCQRLTLSPLLAAGGISVRPSGNTCKHYQLGFFFKGSDQSALLYIETFIARAT